VKPLLHARIESMRRFQSASELVEREDIRQPGSRANAIGRVTIKDASNRCK